MDEFITEFKNTDIIVYQGAITTYEIIKPLLTEDDYDNVRLANTKEQNQWFNRPENSKR